MGFPTRESPECNKIHNKLRAAQRDGKARQDTINKTGSDPMSIALGDMLVPEAICVQYPARDAREVIIHLGNLLYEAGYVKDTFVDAALAREAAMPTGLPLAGDDNAAMPHTDIEHVIRPGVALATLQRPVIFHNMVSPEEEVPVRLVFLLALDQPKSQIEMLQQVAGVLQDAQLVASLLAAKDKAEVRAILTDHETRTEHSLT
jgi:PTS system galactitol-specific IIA component